MTVPPDLPTDLTTETPPAPAAPSPPVATTDDAGPGPDELTAIRDVVLKAYPDVVPDLVRGDSAAALLASVEPARAAYARIQATIQANIAPVVANTPPMPTIPAGGGAPLPVDPDRLPPSEKIRRGLVTGRNRS
ncbi:MAG TPA: hypothetical protein VNZ55_01265 [Thermomicrobiales bacterium]|nr:hypothetical protein [Thermomicrobiales bacterium]